MAGMKQPAGPAPRRYWVVGGVYSDTAFDELADEAGEERFGPFRSFAEAKEEWARLAWRSVDDCHARYRVTVETDAGG